MSSRSGNSWRDSLGRFTTEDQAVEDGDRAETHRTVHARGGFARSVQSGNRLVGANVKHAAFNVRHETAHAVMDLGREFTDEPGTVLHRDLFLVDVAAPRRIGAVGDHLVEAVDFLLEDVEIDAATLGKRFERVVAVDDLALDHLFEVARAQTLELVANGLATLAVLLFKHDRVGTNLAVGEFVHEALAVGVDPNAKFGGIRLVEFPTNAHALFTRIAPRTALNPVVLDLHGADRGGFAPEFGRGAGLVRAVELFVELRVLEHAVNEVGAEPAVAEDDTLRGRTALNRE